MFLTNKLLIECLFNIRKESLFLCLPLSSERADVDGKCAVCCKTCACASAPFGTLFNNNYIIIIIA